MAEIELPGVDPKNIEVEVKDNILKVEARTEKKKAEGIIERESARVIIKEYFHCQ